jgi:acyl-coenzyme A thioesterase PaaI-like protein
MTVLPPRQDFTTSCFCCGTENPLGLKLRFTKESPTTVSTRFTAPDHWTGWGTIMHGGFQCLILDEVMSWAVWAAMDKVFVTREIKLRFRRPVHVAQPLTFYGHVVEDKGQQVTTRGEIKDPEGNVLTESEGVMVLVSPEKLESMTDQDPPVRA